MRKLSLKKETVVELTPSELTSVVGAGTTTCITKAPCTGTGSANCSYDDGCVTARGCLTDWC